MRHLTTALLTLALLMGMGTSAYAMASAAPVQAEPRLLPSPVLGIYDVPGGTLTVREDGTAHYVPASTPTPVLVPGACAEDTTNATTGEVHAPVYACAPTYAPDGAQVDVVFEDGSATYQGSTYVYDPEQGGFVLTFPSYPSEVYGA
jgi:hypothetical protein